MEDVVVVDDDDDDDCDVYLALFYMSYLIPRLALLLSSSSSAKMVLER